MSRHNEYERCDSLGPNGECSTCDPCANLRSALHLAEARIAEAETSASLHATREKQATEMCSWLTKENQRLRDALAIHEVLDKDWDEMLEQSEEDCVENVQFQHLVLEACDIAAKWLAVVMGDAPIFANGDTKRSTERIAAIRAAILKTESAQ